VWIYLVTFAGTLAWALWEVGFDGWAQVPRLVAPTVVLVLVLLCIPVLSRGARHGRGAAVTAGVAGLAALIGSSAVIFGSDRLTALAQPQPSPPPAELEEPEVESAVTEEPAEAPYAPMRQTGADWPAYGGTHHATRYSPLEQITRENVADLELIWEFRTGD